MTAGQTENTPNEGNILLTRIRDAYTLSTADEKDTVEVDRLMVGHFLHTLADIALAVAARNGRGMADHTGESTRVESTKRESTKRESTKRESTKGGGNARVHENSGLFRGPLLCRHHKPDRFTFLCSENIDPRN